MLGLDQLSPEDRSVVARARRLERFLTQPFFTTEQFSGIKGQSVSLKDALDGCERILKDEFKDYPESALYMIGSIDQAKKGPAKKPVKKSNASDTSQNTSVPNATANPAPDKQPDATAKPDADKKQDADKKPDMQTSKSEAVAGA
jgi:F-type H+-transporting ATPase subunit beta